MKPACAWLLAGAALWAQPRVLAQSRPVTTRFAFEEPSSGGTLTLAPMRLRDSPYVCITNTPGESGESVARRLADAANASAAYVSVHGKVQVEGSALVLHGFPGDYLLGGDERGLGIPQPLRSVSASYDAGSRDVAIRWETPPGEYDRVVVMCGGFPVGSATAESGEFIYRKSSFLRRLERDKNLEFMAIGLRRGVPSNGAAIRLRHTRTQDEIVNIPYSQGVAPNWVAWSNATENGQVRILQGVKPDVPWPQEWYDEPAKKRFYQRIEGHGVRLEGGTLRRFLGLQPGGTYRVAVRVNTLDMPTAGDWSFTVHVAHGGTNGAPLDVRQLAGLAALADGSQGPSAGLIAEYNAGKTTGGEWVERTTGLASAPGMAADVRLPGDVDSLTIWTRVTGTRTAVSGVGLDWVAISRFVDEDTIWP